MAKLNKEQLKKLYDYGGTLSPRDWADMIDNIDPIYNKNSLPIVKTTYEEVRELYYAGKMDPNVKYEFDYTFKPSYDTIYPVSKLQVYVTPSGNLKAEGVGGDEYNFYPFVADFGFDKLLVGDVYTDDEDVTIYEAFKSHIIHCYNESIIDTLDQYNFEYEVKMDESDGYNILIKDVIVFNSQAFNDKVEGYIDYTHIVNKSGVEIKCYDPNPNNDNISTPTVTKVECNIKPIAAIYNIQYNGKFHYKLLDGILENLGETILQCYASVYGTDHSDYIDWENIISDDGTANIKRGVIINSQLSLSHLYISNNSPILIVGNRNFGESDDNLDEDM